MRKVTITTIQESTYALPLPVVPRQQFYLVRERVYSECDLSHIIMQLRNERSTGTLTIHLSQGGVCHVSFSDRQPIPVDPSE
jgi:hypothetical protein